MAMEYITGVTTLQAIFTIHWLAYCDWYKGVIITEKKTKHD